MGVWRDPFEGGKVETSRCILLLKGGLMVFRSIVLPLPAKGWLLIAASTALVAACGGGGDAYSESGNTRAASAAEAGSSQAPPSNASSAAFARRASLSNAELAAAEQQAKNADIYASSMPLAAYKPGEIAAKGAYLSGDVARKAAAVRIPAYRFYNGSTGAHFFTTSTSERDNVVADLSPPFSLEGEAFAVANAFSPGLSPVHRFYNAQTGVHFYTISEAERANVVATLPQYSYEGVAYHASQVAGAGLVPFYRFYVPSRGFHFYTATESEKDSIIANLAATYSYEGVGYYVLDSDWRAEKLPHSGVTSLQCYEASSNVPVGCAETSVMNLNPLQDGHRVNVNPLDYSAVDGHSLDACVRDNVTGLIWEGKAASGTRAGSHTYTHLGNGQATDASGYVVTVNSAKLCGFSDWRLPTRQELMNIVDYGGAVSTKVNPAWFPNTAAGLHWAAELDSSNSANAWYVSFFDGHVSAAARSASHAVRLVRGSALSGSRYSYSTVAYAGDGANNAVNDAWTGLQWRRCEEGRIWNGIECSVGSSSFTHEQALAHARDQASWRLPNVKELSSLMDLSVSGGALLHPVAFPGAYSSPQWAASPFSSDNDLAWYVYFNTGYVANFNRGTSALVRLVRASP